MEVAFNSVFQSIQVNQQDRGGSLITHKHGQSSTDSKVTTTPTNKLDSLSNQEYLDNSHSSSNNNHHSKDPLGDSQGDLHLDPLGDNRASSRNISCKGRFLLILKEGEERERKRDCVT